MKILHAVEQYAPVPGGMQEVVRQLSERLVRFGHKVTVATSRHPERKGGELNGVRIIDFAAGGNQVRGLSGEIDAYREFLLSEQFDLITVFAAQQWSADAFFPLLDRINARKVFVPTGFSALNHHAYQDYFAAMPGWLRRFDMNVFHSDSYRDIRFARDHGIDNLVVIPNGADEEEMGRACPEALRRQLGIPADDFLVLHVGSHTGLKGHAEAIEIFRRAVLGRATFLLVGNLTSGCYPDCLARAEALNVSRAFRAAGKRILVRELPRRETVAAFHAADLLLFPSNIECSPLVLFEAAASRTPFLVTDVGNAAEIVAWTGGGVVLKTRALEPGRGLTAGLRALAGRLGVAKPVTAGEYGLVMADVASAAKLLEQLHDDAPARERLAQAGFDAWQGRFTWGKIARDYERLYQALLSRPLPGTD